MISGLVLKYLNGECFVIRRGYETTLPVSSSFCLTVPSEGMLYAALGQYDGKNSDLASQQEHAWRSNSSHYERKYGG